MTEFNGVLNELSQEDEPCRNFAFSRLREVWGFFLWSNIYLTQFFILIPGSCLYYVALSCWKPSRTVWKRMKLKDTHIKVLLRISLPKMCWNLQLRFSFSYTSFTFLNFLINFVLTTLERTTQLWCYQLFCPEPHLVWHSLAWCVLTHLDEQRFEDHPLSWTHKTFVVMCVLKSYYKNS